MEFNPNEPFEVEDEEPEFDPNQPFEADGEGPPPYPGRPVPIHPDAPAMRGVSPEQEAVFKTPARGAAPTRQAEEIAPWRSALMGASQGATYNLIDEGISSVAAIPGAFSEDGYLSRREKIQKKLNERVNRHREANPRAYLGGEVAGGLGSLVAVPGSAIPRAAGFWGTVGRGMLTGAKAGGLSGFGASEAQLTENPLQVAKDTGVGVGAGAVLSGAVSTVPGVRNAYRSRKEYVTPPAEFMKNPKAVMTSPTKEQGGRALADAHETAQHHATLDAAMAKDMSKSKRIPRDIIKEKIRQRKSELSQTVDNKASPRQTKTLKHLNKLDREYSEVRKVKVKGQEKPVTIKFKKDPKGSSLHEENKSLADLIKFDRNADEPNKQYDAETLANLRRDFKDILREEFGDEYSKLMDRSSRGIRASENLPKLPEHRGDIGRHANEFAKAGGRDEIGTGMREVFDGLEGHLKDFGVEGPKLSETAQHRQAREELRNVMKQLPDKRPGPLKGIVDMLPGSRTVKDGINSATKSGTVPNPKYPSEKDFNIGSVKHVLEYLHPDDAARVRKALGSAAPKEKLAILRALARSAGKLVEGTFSPRNIGLHAGKFADGGE